MDRQKTNWQIDRTDGWTDGGLADWRVDELMDDSTCDVDDAGGQRVVSSLDLPVDVSTWRGEHKLSLLKPDRSKSWCQTQNWIQGKSWTITASTNTNQNIIFKLLSGEKIWLTKSEGSVSV